MSIIDKPRGRQVRPNRAELTAAWSRIRDAADKGSILASALLITLSENKPFVSCRELFVGAPEPRSSQTSATRFSGSQNSEAWRLKRFPLAAFASLALASISAWSTWLT